MHYSEKTKITLKNPNKNTLETKQNKKKTGGFRENKPKWVTGFLFSCKILILTKMQQKTKTSGGIQRKNSKYCTVGFKLKVSSFVNLLFTHHTNEVYLAPYSHLECSDNHFG